MEAPCGDTGLPISRSAGAFACSTWSLKPGRLAFPLHTKPPSHAHAHLRFGGAIVFSHGVRPPPDASSRLFEMILAKSRLAGSPRQIYEAGCAAVEHATHPPAAKTRVAVGNNPPANLIMLFPQSWGSVMRDVNPARQTRSYCFVFRVSCLGEVGASNCPTRSRPTRLRAETY